jgi:Tannase and feruloyl esterase
MNMRHLSLPVLLMGALALGTQHVAAATCESLTGVSLPNTTITGAQLVPAGALAPPGAPPIIQLDNLSPGPLPAFCRVTGTAKPTSDSDINFEVWMPTSGWNGKFNGTGNGGYGGSFSIPYGNMALGLQRGYAVAGTDMGHSATNAAWALNQPQKIIDWAYRANHVTATNAKVIIRAFYGAAPRLSYFTGCSDGGHEALMEAQRYPDDYDGIIAGDAANFWTHQSAAWVWEAQATLRDPASFIPAGLLPMITAAVVSACAYDEAAPGDGYLNDPRKCQFNPAALSCKAGQDPSTCLTPPQIEAVKKIYAGPSNSRGVQIYPGLEPGSEGSDVAESPLLASWTDVISGPQPLLGGDFFRYFVFNDPNWNFETLNYDSDIALADAKMANIVNSNNPDLKPFRAHGGKLIIYHGWVDSLVSSRNSINYYETVIRDIAGNPGIKAGDVAYGNAKHQADTFVRLFMVPGMGHCELGPGPNNFGQPQVKAGPTDAAHNLLSALAEWVENGVAPDRIIATRYVNSDPSQTVLRTRPLCPYPQVARWKGTGNTNDAANFDCVEERDNNRTH